MTSFTQFVIDSFNQSPKLLAIARHVKVGPKHMLALEKHQAYNVAAATFTVIMLVLTRNSISPNDIDAALSVLVTVGAFSIFTIVGFFANLAEVSNERSAKIAEKAGTELANKWTTYLILNFALVIPTYWILNEIYFWLDGSTFDAMLMRISDNTIPWELSALFSSLLSTSLSSALLYLVLCKSKKIIEPSPTWQKYYLITVIICGLLFYLVTFVWEL